MNICTFSSPTRLETATVTVPGSKSYTNRALIMAAITKGSVRLRNPLYSDDTEAMISCLSTLGLRIEQHPDEIIVQNDISSITPGTYELNARDSGTTIRFLLALSCILPGTQIITGSPRLRERPIADLVTALEHMGAAISYQGPNETPPIQVSSDGLSTHTVSLPGTVSSQYFTALLLISPLIGGMTITVEHEQISKPYIDMTVDLMHQWGVRVENNHYQQYHVSADQRYQCADYLIEGDFSSAGYFFAIATRTGATITIENLNPSSKQADARLPDTLEALGSSIHRGTGSITITGTPIPPVDIDMEDFPDQVQTMAVLSAFANGRSTIRGVQSLRVKETERVHALQTELKKMGIETNATHDMITIYGGNPHAAQISTYRDHRMAMSFAVAAATLPGMRIEDPEVVNKTFPSFWDKLNEIGMNSSVSTL